MPKSASSLCVPVRGERAATDEYRSYPRVGAAVGVAFVVGVGATSEIPRGRCGCVARRVPALFAGARRAPADRYGCRLVVMTVAVDAAQLSALV